MFALFASARYQECGGWGDFKGVFPLLEECRSKYETLVPEMEQGMALAWGEIVDLETLQVVARKPSALTYWKFPPWT